MTCRILCWLCHQSVCSSVCLSVRHCPLLTDCPCTISAVDFFAHVSVTSCLAGCLAGWLSRRFVFLLVFHSFNKCSGIMVLYYIYSSKPCGISVQIIKISFSHLLVQLVCGYLFPFLRVSISFLFIDSFIRSFLLALHFSRVFSEWLSCLSQWVFYVSYFRRDASSRNLFVIIVEPSSC